MFLNFVYISCFLFGLCTTVSSFISNSHIPLSTRSLHPGCVTSQRQRVTSSESLTMSDTTDEDIPRDLPSEAGIDYIPLATMLATGDFKEADQFTRDALIKAAGPGAQSRNYVYWTEVRDIPTVDMITMEKLWNKFSDGKFGYSVQRKFWNKEKDFDRFIRKIGWTTMDGEVERKLRWFGQSEFIYDLEKAPVGHLPLTSALRGTQLIKAIMEHPCWETDWKDKEDTTKTTATKSTEAQTKDVSDGDSDSFFDSVLSGKKMKDAEESDEIVFPF